MKVINNDVLRKARCDTNTYLSQRGYAVDNNDANRELVEYLKEYCTVSPRFNPNVVGVEKKVFPVYRENTKKLYIPRALGLELLGDPKNISIHEGEDVPNLKFCGELRPEQHLPVEAFLAAAKDPCKLGGILNLACGAGKCLDPKTPVVMFDGTIKFAKDVVVSDMLMGDDSTPRRVLSTCTGFDPMYRVTQTGGLTYIVNEAHILSLVNGIYGSVIDICISDYLALPQIVRDNMYGYRVAVEFQEGVDVNNAYNIGFTHGSSKERLPKQILYGSRVTRQNALDGIVDAIEDSMIVTGCTGFLHDVAFLANSLGYRAVYREATSLEIDVAATRLMHIQVEGIGVGSYAGFEVDGNGRFLLGDFTVTHNTTMSLYIASVLKKATLVVCHKDFLISQWRERIQQFVPDAKVGLIKAKTIDIQDKDIVLATLQSLAMKDYDPLLFRKFGLVIIDEVHHTSAEIFSQALPKITAPIMMGLSATLDRKDGLRKVFEWFLGRPVFKSKKRDDTETTVEVVPFYDRVYSNEILMKNGKINIAAMINSICSCPDRNALIVAKITEVISRNKERKVLILGDRRAHLTQLEKMIREAGIRSVGQYVGGMKPDALSESAKCQVILATNIMASEGLDIPTLNTLFLVTPVSSVEQQVGRIQRQKPENRACVPYIVDITDDFSVFKTQGMRRRAFYKRSRFTFVNNMQDSNDKAPLEFLPEDE